MNKKNSNKTISLTITQYMLGYAQYIVWFIGRVAILIGRCIYFFIVLGPIHFMIFFNQGNYQNNEKIVTKK